MAHGGQGQYLDWGAATTLAASVGIVTGGEVGPPKSAVEHRRGIYAQDRVVGKMLEYTGSATFNPTGTNDATLIGYALRSSYTVPSLTALCFEGGHVSAFGWKHTGCEIGDLKLSQAMDGALEAEIAWQGTDGSRTAAPSPQTAETGATYEWFKASIELDTGTYDAREISVSVANNLEPYSSLDAGSTNSLRKPEGVKVGSEVVTVSLVVLADIDTAFDLDADDLDDDIDIVWVASNGTRDLTITLSNLACTANPMPYQSPDGLVVWNVELEAEQDTAGVISIADSAAS